VIAISSLSRLFSHSHEEIMFTDWVVTITGILTPISAFLYNYYGVTLATWNNLLVGGAVLLLPSVKIAKIRKWTHGTRAIVRLIDRPSRRTELSSAMKRFAYVKVKVNSAITSCFG
jgi:hypothetical protein